MIDFHGTWLPAILSYARLVADETVLRDAWLNQDRSRTSIYYPGELIDQIFEDLDSSNVIKTANIELSQRIPVATAISRFLDALTNMFEAESAKLDMGSWGQGKLPLNAAEIFDSPSWIEARRRAQDVLSAAEVR